MGIEGLTWRSAVRLPALVKALPGPHPAHGSCHLPSSRISLYIKPMAQGCVMAFLGPHSRHDMGPGYGRSWARTPLSNCFLFWSTRVSLVDQVPQGLPMQHVPRTVVV